MLCALASLREFLLNPQIRQRFADGIDDLDEARVRLLETIHRRNQPLIGKVAELRIRLNARRLVRRKAGKIGDAVRLFAVGFGKRGDFRLQRAEQLQQLRLALDAYGIRATDLRLNLADGFFNHVLKELNLRLASGKQNHHRPTLGRRGWTIFQISAQTKSLGSAPLINLTRCGSLAAMTP